MTVLILIFSHDGTDASTVERDKVRGTKENEGWKEKGEVSRDDEEAGEVERALSGAEERLGKKGTRERIACIPFDGLFPVNQGTERVFHQKDSKWIRRFEPAISANFSPASTHCFSSLANYLENFASLCRHRCRRDFKGTDPII